jgi:hypothetical protein
MAVLREHYQQIEDFFSKIVADGQKNGTFGKSAGPKAAAWQFIFAGIGYAMISLNLGGTDKELTREVIESLVRGVKG